ncbi:unnamed protein product [Aureobasidium vineae]|uniref:BTB domain-containing protein n=1 Tax=Aureobasidium vineae TaxID=2773715 RepID=A0A9N8J8G5_9PEZI|nr:unnamed protein product [Aureobasidium vineae]
MSTPSKGAVSTPDKWPSRYGTTPAKLQLVPCGAYTFNSEHFQETVTLIVGIEKKAYNVRKDLLCFYSDYFRAAFQGSFKEATERKIDLPRVTKDVFEHFQVWRYTRKLDTAALTFDTMARLWIFGDKHQIPLLQNQVMDSIFAKCTTTKNIDPGALPAVYARTVARSPLRKAFIEIIGWTVGIESEPDTFLSRNAVNWTNEIFVDLVIAVHQSRVSQDVKFPALPKRDKCFFHIHSKDEHC